MKADTKVYITFKSLIFKKHPIIENITNFSGISKRYENAKIAHKLFDNDYGVSVVFGEAFYSNVDTYEVAILYKGKICEDPKIAEDIFGYQTKDQVSDIMIIVQELDKNYIPVSS